MVNNMREGRGEGAKTKLDLESSWEELEKGEEDQTREAARGPNTLVSEVPDSATYG